MELFLGVVDPRQWLIVFPFPLRSDIPPFAPPNTHFFPSTPRFLRLRDWNLVQILSACECIHTCHSERGLFHSSCKIHECTQKGRTCVSCIVAHRHEPQLDPSKNRSAMPNDKEQLLGALMHYLLCEVFPRSAASVAWFDAFWTNPTKQRTLGFTPPYWLNKGCNCSSFMK